jgi:acyl carrier protein
MFLETKAGIKVDPVEVNLDNLDSIDKILAYVASKQ